MRHSVFAFLALLAVMLTTPARLEAARDPAPATASVKSGLELLVFEREDCHICEIFRRQIGSRYAMAPVATEAPMRYIDIDKVDLDKIRLKSRLTMLPTVVLMQNGREVERINGLTAPDTFFTLVQHMMNRVD
jgi:thioredoxin-related protein